MKNRIFGASYERADELIAAGCPIDYLDALAHHSFRVEQLPGYVASCVYALGPIDTGYVIALRLATDRSPGTIIRDWSFEPPWQNHAINWDDYGPEDIIPKQHQDDYKRLFKSRLTGVLNDGRLIRRGCPVDGVLCGRSYQSIGEYSHGFISAKLGFTDDLGNTVPLCIDLKIDTHSYLSTSRLSGREAGHGPFRHVDPEEWFDPSAIPAGPVSDSESLHGDAATDQGSRPGRETGGSSAGVAQDVRIVRSVGDAETIQTGRTELRDAVQ